jgi:hypothetical protein
MTLFKCSQCEFKSFWAYNTDRHFNRKHSSICINLAGKDDILAGKDDILAGKDDILTGKDDILTGKDDIKNNKMMIPYQCDKCDKIITRKYNLCKHMDKCKGKINKLECQICNKILSSKESKYRHQKICKEKHNYKNINKDYKEEIKNITNISICNITNNIDNLIVFPSGDIDDFISNKVFENKIKNILKLPDNYSIVANYNKELFSIKENQCIKKTNLKSQHSQVHIGDNKWESRLDKEIYPKMVSCLANDLCMLLHDKKKCERIKILEDFLSCIIDNGYINDDMDKQKEMLNNFKNLVSNLKLLIYDITKNDEI